MSTQLEDKLSLASQKHFQPYSLTCLKKVNEISVDKRCPVVFLIERKFKSRCDVIRAYGYMSYSSWFTVVI